MSELLVLSLEEIVEINRKFNGGVKRGGLDFIISKIKSFALTADFRKDVAKSAEHYGIISSRTMFLLTEIREQQQRLQNYSAKPMAFISACRPTDLSIFH